MNQTDISFCIAHLLRRPADATESFYDFLAPKLLDQQPRDMMSQFFNEHEDLALEVQRRAEHCERYTQYLEENGLYETEMARVLAEAKAFREKLGLAS